MAADCRTERRKARMRTRTQVVALVGDRTVLVVAQLSSDSLRSIQQFRVVILRVDRIQQQLKTPMIRALPRASIVRTYKPKAKQRAAKTGMFDPPLSLVALVEVSLACLLFLFFLLGPLWRSEKLACFLSVSFLRGYGQSIAPQSTDSVGHT